MIVSRNEMLNIYINKYVLLCVIRVVNSLFCFFCSAVGRPHC